MGSANIQAKIKRGLAKAVNKTGSSASEKVYLVSQTKTGGDGVNAPTISEVLLELPNAIFKSYDASLLDGNILAGDRQLVSDNTVEIQRGFTIRQGEKSYVVVSVDIKAPTSDVLTYISQVRQQ